MALSNIDKNHLDKTVKHYCLEGCFNSVLGTNNFVAEGKGLLAQRLVLDRPDIKNWIFIGDTFLDFEVSRSVGGSFLFVDWGHTSKQRICSAGLTPVSTTQSLFDSLLSFF